MIVKPGIPDELRWFYKARFGMFVHYGISSLLGRGEWVMYWENIPRREYEKLAADFNPIKFSAADWVGLAVDAGARYMTVTAKHHDGFCLFDSKLTDFTSTNTPFGRDIIGELADECGRRSLPLILYYSQPDWHHPNFVHNSGAFKDLDAPPESDEPDWEKYLEFYIGQVEELMKQYEPAGIWFDGSHKTEEEWRGREVYELIKRYDPNAIVNDRGRYGDMFTPERSLPEDLTGYLFEACQSISKQAWGYREDSDNFTVPELVGSLQKMAGAGGNYLLNVGPRPDGSIDPTQRRIMLAIGRWLENHGEAIYETEPVDVGRAAGGASADASSTHGSVSRGDAPPRAPARDGGVSTLSSLGGDGAALAANLRLTGRGSTLYVHLLDWPETDRIRIPAPGPGAVTRLSVLRADGGAEAPNADDAGLEVRHREADIEIRLPPAPWQTLPAVLRLELDSPVPVKPPSPPERPTTWPVQVGPAGASGVELVLDPRDLSRAGRGPKGKRAQPMDIPGYGGCLDGWMDGAQSVAFAVELAGGHVSDLEVLVDLAVPRGMDDGVLAVDVDGVRATEVKLAGTYQNEPGDSARGRMTVPCARDFAPHRVVLRGLAAGRHEVRLYPATLHWGYLFGFLGRIRARAAAGT